MSFNNSKDVTVTGSSITYIAVEQNNTAQDTHLPRAVSATLESLDSTDLAHCLKGTREDVLHQVYSWINGDSERIQENEPSGNADVNETPHIFWINGSAGTGKTTIAYTIAATCKTNKTLGATFFCSRYSAERSNPNLIFTTIAHQLGQFFTPFKTEITRILKSDPDIGSSSVPYQLEELIIKPLRAVRKLFPSCLVIFDALDECKDDRVTSVILSSLSRHLTELSPLKFLITSRPEQNIASAFKPSTELGPLARSLILHEIELGVVQQDIEHYLTSSLSQIREEYYLENSWPSASDTHSLAVLSNGLFIFAATSVNFIRDRNYSSPADQLASLLINSSTVAQIRSSPHRRLDELYMQVLDHAFPNIAPSLANRIKIVLGSIILLRDPLSSCALENLLKLRPTTVRQTLRHLHSVVTVPEDDTHAIRLLHPSFFDFMTDPTRCQKADFVVNAPTQHTLLARACLQTMKSLKRDMCKIQNPTMLNSEVHDLPSRITGCIPSHTQYACRHWALHLTNALFSDDLLVLMQEFCLKYLLYWIEICSLLGELRNALVSLHDAQHFLANKGREVTDIITLLYDCERFTREFFTILNISSLQVYDSALLFTPRRTLLYMTYQHELVLLIKQYNAVEETWSSCTRVMDGHSNYVSSVVFSSDGTHIVSGSWDGTLRLWDTVSGAHLNSLKGHSAPVASVAFSPGGMLVVSGSWDNSLWLWDTVTGSHLNTLEGHSHCVRSVAFSPDGTTVVSGSDDHTLRLWDIINCVHLNTLEGHSALVRSVAFSPDGACVMSGSDDGTVRLWDVVNGVHLRTLEGHSGAVNSVAFSPDGTCVVSGSDDHTLRIWDKVSGDHINTLEGHPGSMVRSVAFSPDSTHVVLGSDDGTVQFWDIVSGVHLRTLEGHSSVVNSVAFSPDGTRVVSGSWDKTLRLWDTMSITHLNTFARHSSQVLSVAFFHDGTRVVSGSCDNTLRLWDTISGAHLNTLAGHSGPVTSVASSPDGTHVVSGSEDRTVRLWDTVRGTHLNTLVGHSHWVKSVSFSPDGTCVASGSYDATVRLWDTVSGAHLNSLEGHSHGVTSVAFSSDGTCVVSGSWDNTVRLWDVVTGAHINTLRGHSDTVRSIAFSPGGICIVSRYYDNTLRLWDTVNDVLLNTLPEPTVSLYSSITHFCACSLDPQQSSFSQSITKCESDRHVGYLVDKDGWLCFVYPRRRICWVPVSCRPGDLAFSGSLVALGTGDGRVIILDLQNLPPTPQP